MAIERMAIIGAGTMGTGIAQVAAQAGLQVTVIDTDDAALQRSQVRLDKSLQGAVEREKLTAEQAEEVRARIAWSTAWDTVAQADLVLEAVFEELQAKRGVLARVGELARPEAILASNTSTLPIAELGEITGRPERFLGMHFFNPPPAMKLVEVIPGPRTDPQVTAAALALCERMGKEPKLAPDIPGFLVNRVFGAVLAAAVDIWLHGAEPADIDAAVELGLGHRMGPLATADLVGLDVCVALMDSLHAQTRHERFAVAPELRALVEAGKLGRKTGEGFYVYES